MDGARAVVKDEGGREKRYPQRRSLERWPGAAA